MEKLVPKGFVKFPEWIWTTPDGEKYKTVLRDNDKSPNARCFLPKETDRLREIWEEGDHPEATFQLSASHRDIVSTVKDMVYLSTPKKVGQINLLAEGQSDSGIRAIKGLKGHRARVDATDCKISHCTFAEFSCQLKGDVTISDCSFGVLRISMKRTVSSYDKDSVNLRISNCKILRLEIRDIDGLRDIHIGQNVYIASSYAKPRTNDIPSFASNLFLDRPTFSMLHGWAEKKGNSKLAHFARGHELAVERAEADRSEAVFLTLWWALSNYGLSYWRPLLWLAASTLTFSILLFCNGTHPGIEAHALHGWRSSLIGDELSARVYRSVVGAVESIFAPFSVFSTRRLVIPSDGWVAAIQFFYSYFCLGLLFLVAFSVRRRFKV